jgi:hypothetical protein
MDCCPICGEFNNQHQAFCDLEETIVEAEEGITYGKQFEYSFYDYSFETEEC